MTHLNAWNFVKINLELKIWSFFHINRIVFLKVYIVKLNELSYSTTKKTYSAHLKSGLNYYIFTSNQTRIKDNLNFFLKLFTSDL